VHDKKIADQTYLSALESCKAKIVLWQDTGYQGFSPDKAVIRQPVKKPKGKELTTQQKQYNRMVSGVRVRIEHAIGSIKRYRVVKDECRLRKNNYTGRVFAICAALHNLRIIKQPFSYTEINLT
jgi:hypothetical protein